jgi:prophage regulatory protein
MPTTSEQSTTPHIHAAASPAEQRVTVLERKPDVLRRTGLSNSALYAGMARGFPRPVKLGTGRAVAWVKAEIDAWIEARIAERDARDQAAEFAK